MHGFTATHNRSATYMSKKLHDGFRLIIATMLAFVPFVAQAQGWIADSKTACQVWNENPSPSESISWTGSCSNGKATGMGTLQWYLNGKPTSRYDGEYRDGKKHGKGTNIWASGARYEGDWRDEKRHGKGTYVWPNGDRYEGDWSDGKRHGKGTFVFANGTRVEGDWQDGKLQKKCGTDTECVALRDSTKPSGTSPSSLVAAVQEMAPIVSAFDVNKMTNYCDYMKTHVSFGAKQGFGPEVEERYIRNIFQGSAKVSEFEVVRVQEKIGQFVKGCMKTGKSVPVNMEVMGTIKYDKYNFSDKEVRFKVVISDELTTTKIPPDLIEKWKQQLLAAGISAKPAYFKTYGPSGMGAEQPILAAPVMTTFLSRKMTPDEAEKISLEMGASTYPAKFTIVSNRVAARSDGQNFYLTTAVDKFERIKP